MLLSRNDFPKIVQKTFRMLMSGERIIIYYMYLIRINDFQTRFLRHFATLADIILFSTDY